MYNKTVLSSGLRIVSEKVKGFKSCSIGIFLLSGTRDEPAFYHGITHFIEHILFKGTKSRTSLEISKAIEQRGGSIDAFTSKEITALYAKVLNRDFSLALDIMGDLLTEPLFDEREIEKEREVILEEYKEYMDDPEEVLSNLFYESLYPEHPLGREIIGKPRTIKKFKRNCLLKYFRKMMDPSNICVLASGAVEHKKLVSKIEEIFSNTLNKEPFIKNRKSNFKEPLVRKKVLSHLNQTQFALGYRVFGFPDERRFALMVANTVIGGIMSSRFFHKFREELGLVYNIGSFLDFHSDTGVFGVSMSLDHKKFEKTLSILLKEIEKLKKNGLTKKELEIAKSFSIGNLEISLENTSTRLLRLANFEVYFQDYITAQKTLEKIQKLKLDEVNEVLNCVLSEKNRALACVFSKRTNIKL